jgi:hypothetical protein
MLNIIFFVTTKMWHIFKKLVNFTSLGKSFFPKTSQTFGKEMENCVPKTKMISARD